MNRSKMGTPLTVLLLTIIFSTAMVSCVSEKKKAPPIYSYQLPWSARKDHTSGSFPVLGRRRGS